ncbi:MULTISPECIES: hypothetical protein [Streptomyces]|uniref:Secreted protein n=1 Tax=Streptomyces dengpaensis TaxID=2049881 RepID=A0ABM6SN24_9ACTN|nr:MULTISPECIES: hypothetical protein [Streptomyces]AVH55880.1 hypothetical protein C4B68_08975 [Streptomyces dengpaensis]PIB12131.1 hypothetical protein B1C81_02910 [Streptomyces sp. HG99]
MKHRGRHRRRRRGQALRATLAGTALALTAAATLISTSQATADGSPGGLTPVTSAAATAKLRLHENLVARDTLDTLTRRMGGNVGVDGVLQSADRSMRDRAECSTAERAALPVEPTATRAYCWDGGDARTRQWQPRSVTTSGDADDDGQWGEHRVILAGWTHHGSRVAADRQAVADHQAVADRHAADDRQAAVPARDKGLARIAVVDATDPAALTYRWVLLVAPRDGGKDFTAVRSGLGGMVWYQDKLIVTAAHGAGLLVFDMHRILRADVNSAAVGRTGDGYSADGYQYVLPAIGSYAVPGGTCTADSFTAVPCFGSLSLDRTTVPDSLVATEPPGRDRDRARVWRYSYSTAAHRTGLLAGSQGYVAAVEAYETKAAGASGVLSHTPIGAREAQWYVGHASDGPTPRGVLWRQTDGGAKAATCTADQSHACWGLHARSLSYWQETGELWTLTSPAEQRLLYAVPLSSVDDSLE